MQSNLLIFNLLIVFLFVTQIVHSQPLKKDTLSIFDPLKLDSKTLKGHFDDHSADQLLDDYLEFILYQIETTGEFSIADPQYYSVQGNSYRWNRNYYNGFRINDVIFSGSALYKFNAGNKKFSLDVHNSAFEIQDDSLKKGIYLNFNHGGLGGPAPFSEDLIHLYHRTARENEYIPIDEQRKIKNAVEFQYNSIIKSNQKDLPVSFSFNSGSRLLPDFNYTGIDHFYDENYIRTQIEGEYPVLFPFFDSQNYLISMLNRDHLFAENYYSGDETAKFNQINLSTYGKRKRENAGLITGINYSVNSFRHNNLNFSRNIVDQDGEGFEPWYSEGRNSSISAFLNYTYSFNSNLKLTAECYNSLVHFRPYVTNFYNTVYFQGWDSIFHSLHVIEWQSNQFVSGLLENAVSLNYKKGTWNNKLLIKGNVDAVFDGLLVSGKNLLKPNWQSDGSILFSPFKFFDLAIHIGRKRIAFNYDQIKFLSENYLNGNVYYWNDINKDMQYSDAEKGNLYTTTGGKYHMIDANINQPYFYYLEIPVKLTFRGKHSFALYTFYKKFVNLWTVDYNTTSYEFPQNFYGSENEVFYFQYPGEKQFIVSDNSVLSDGKSFLDNTPFAKGYTLKYQFVSKRIFLSASWTAYMVVGNAAMGNGLFANSPDVLSESQASMNTNVNSTGRMDSDRAYLGRFLFGMNISKSFTTSFLFKYRDGQPFSCFEPYLLSTADGQQVAMQTYAPKADNPITGFRGYRKDAFFNTELKISYNKELKNNSLLFSITVYNIYDFGTELAEYTFFPPGKGRYVMELNIPRGIQISLGYQF